jgi:hypothetical protein
MNARRRPTDSGIPDPLQDLHALYQQLARHGRSLLAGLQGLESAEPWQHFPADDARDDAAGYRWYYHRHPAGTGQPDQEHGHFHLFAQERRQGRERALRHLFAVGLRANGLPWRLFTVNGWVTGAAPRSAVWSAQRVAALQLATGHEDIDRFLLAMARLYRPVINDLLRGADAALARLAADRRTACTRRDVEVLSTVAVDLDAPPERRVPYSSFQN